MLDMGKVSSCFVLRYVLKKSPEPCRVLEDFFFLIYLLWVLLGLPCCSGFPLVAARRGGSRVAVHEFLTAVQELLTAVLGLPTAVASLVIDHGF